MISLALNVLAILFLLGVAFFAFILFSRPAKPRYKTPKIHRGLLQ